MAARKKTASSAASVVPVPPPAPVVPAAGETAAPPALASVLGYQLAQAAVAANAVFVRQVGGVLDLRPVEYTILALVHENPGLSSARLAQMLSVSPPNITVWIDRLAGRGWVQREPSATDRRERLLHATAEGARLAADATARLIAAEREAFAHLSAGERAILGELLHKLSRAPGG